MLICGEAEVREAEAFVKAYPNNENAINAYFAYVENKQNGGIPTLPTQNNNNNNNNSLLTMSDSRAFPGQKSIFNFGSGNR